MNTRKPVYEGKAKQLFEGPEPGTLIQRFKDDATAFNGAKHSLINGKGVLNNRISEYLMLKIEDIGIPTHFIRSLNMRDQLVKAVQIIPLEVIVRNYAAGSFAKRFGVDEGKPLGHPLVEYCYKNDKLGDPFLSEDHIFAFALCAPHELDEIRMYAMRINDYLSGLFAGLGIKLVDFKLEFGRLQENDREMLVLADEISPDNCRLWDIATGEKMDKDRFRQDLGKIEDAYRDVARRLGVLPEESNGKHSSTKGRKLAAARIVKGAAKAPAKPKVKPKAKAKKAPVKRKTTTKKKK
ncbi:MAG: phosphoribosylaminoimidazolesuccinocarboxamide synthase [Alphaproteobacteria bacterium]